MACPPKEVSKKLKELIDDYFNHPATTKIVGKDGHAFKKMYRAVGNCVDLIEDLKYFKKDF